MKHDHLIDDVAREMTALDVRPNLEPQVRARIESGEVGRPRLWRMVPVAALAVVVVLVGIGSTWFRFVNQPADAPGFGDRGSAASVSAGSEPAPSASYPRSSSAVASPVVAAAGPRRRPGPRTGDSADLQASPAATEQPQGVVMPTLPSLANPEPLAIPALHYADLVMETMTMPALSIEGLEVPPVGMNERLDAPARRGAL